jgi:hypothetical protein
MDNDYSDFVPKHLARNVPIDFEAVCQRIRHREQIFVLKKPRSGAVKYLEKYGELLAILQCVETAEPSPMDFYIGQELDEVRVRFLAVMKTIDKTVPVKLVSAQLESVRKAVHKAVRNLEDPDRDAFVEYYSGNQQEASLTSMFEGANSLAERVSYAHRYLSAVSKNIDDMAWFFNYKYNKTARGNPSKFALIYVVFALADLFEKYSDGLSATVNETVNDGGDGRPNSRRYTGEFLRFVLTFLTIYASQTTYANLSSGLEDQIRKLSKARHRDPDLYMLLHGEDTTPQHILAFMKRADAVKLS